MASYADGHISWVSNNISMTTYMALGTRAFGDIVGPDAP
jgi:hypothetical protein